jgi:O-antigen ligase/tetratricopeptide (TPR) repeat protein
MTRLTRTGRLVLWLVVLLIVLAPLPEGSAHRWALPVIEVLVFGLIAIWQLAIASGSGLTTSFSRGRPFALPLLLFTVIALVQLVPLPPGLLRTVSPATYRLYELSLPGWPHEQPLQALKLRTFDNRRPQWKVLPTVNEVANGATVPFARSGKSTDGTLVRHFDGVVGSPSLWRTISIAPSMSETALLELVAYAALFFLILLYPFGAVGVDTNRAVYRAIVMAALFSGLFVATIGIVEFFTWNGKVLWLFVPYDWGQPHPGLLARATGPFVSPDHFADYLALVLPLAAGGALFRSDLFSKQRAFRVFSGVTAFLIVCALLLSLSRAAWIASVISLAILFAFSARMPQAAWPRVLRLEPGTFPHQASVMALALIALSLLFIGPAGRQQVDLRLQQTVYSDSGFGGRLELAKNTLAMAQDYPVLGVGLSCWPEMFPHYRLAPWIPVIYREAHNDYAQLLAETGIVGFALIAWFFIVIVRRFYKALGAGTEPLSPTFAAVCAALSVVAFHEFFDFPLHTPANALLFVALLALAVRMAEGSHAEEPYSDGQWPRRPGPGQRIGAACVGTLAIVLLVWTLGQQTVPYPYDIRTPDSVTDALALICVHPAESAPHLDLVRLGGARLGAEQRMAQLRAAVWLDPTNPYARDMYAQALLRQGVKAQALADITRSVAASPALSNHFYLNERLIPWLSAPAKKAVERGFKEAIRHRYDGAVQGLAEFYGALGRFVDAAELYCEAAEVERAPDIREQYLIGAGIYYARAGDLDNAQKSLEAAVQNDPTDIRPYRYLATIVFGPRHDLEAAQKLVAHGVRAGANPPALYEALADAAQADGNAQMVESALSDAVDSQPTFSSLFRLGMFYFGERKYDRAALTLRHAVEANPQSADAYFYLGVSEESDYRFSDADRDLSRAVQLAPANAGYRTHYTDFERKVAQGIKASQSANE